MPLSAKQGVRSKQAETSNTSISGVATAGIALFSTTATKATNGCRISSERTGDEGRRRNERRENSEKSPCPCGSGKKYKKCCGKL